MTSIAALGSYTGLGTSLVSFVLPPNAQLSQAIAKIRSELSTAANVQSRV
jgi:peptide subunit release factor 1 (eRF1)|uniref:eRF1/Pelota-like N-terminal domain-containing protein n=1 Tax=viral metagenome TaxID=1070528 RepID=A0A6C0E994_9ZZZZ